MIQNRNLLLAATLLPLTLNACGSGAENKTDATAGMGEMAKPESDSKSAKDVVTLTARQIADAGIELARRRYPRWFKAILRDCRSSRQRLAAVLCNSPEISDRPCDRAIHWPSSKAARRHRSTPRSRRHGRGSRWPNPIYGANSVCSPNVYHPSRI